MSQTITVGIINPLQHVVDVELDDTEPIADVILHLIRLQVVPPLATGYQLVTATGENLPSHNSLQDCGIVRGSRVKVVPVLPGTPHQAVDVAQVKQADPLSLVDAPHITASEPIETTDQHEPDDVDLSALPGETDLPTAIDDFPTIIIRPETLTDDETASNNAFVLVFDDGARVYLDGALVVGRLPSIPVQSPTATPLKLQDDSRTVSKNHVILEAEREGVTIVDLNSTNGTSVTTPDGQATDAIPGQPLFAGVGSVIHIGARFATVEPAQPESTSP